MPISQKINTVKIEDIIHEFSLYLDKDNGVCSRMEKICKYEKLKVQVSC